jgi:polar amino acid transport system permease protein
MGAYGSEIVRAAIQAVPSGQSEVSVALSLSPWQRLRYVIVPQAFRVMLPPFGNLMIELLKGTALVSLITLSDVLDHAQKIRTNHIDKSPAVYTAVLIVYFVLSTFLTVLTRVAERFASRPYRTAPPRFSLLSPFRRGSGISASEEFG